MRSYKNHFSTMMFGMVGAAIFSILSHAYPVVAQNVKEFIVRLQDVTPGTQQTGNANISGKMIAGQFQGGGSALTGLNASNLATGSVPDARLSSNVARRDQANLFSVGPNQFDGFLGVGRNVPVTGSEVFGIGNNSTGFSGMYVRTGATGLPFYGYSLNGAASAFSYLDGSTGTWRLNVSGGDKIHVTPGGFVGIKRDSQITSFESFGIGNNATSFDGMYVRTSTTGRPYYGYSLNGQSSVYHYVDGQDQGKWKLVNGTITALVVTNSGLVGIGTGSPASRVHVESGSGLVGTFSRTNAPGGTGVYGYAGGGNESYGLLGYDAAGNGYGVFSSGNFVALGNKSFQIDHPLDPENRYLLHYCTESPKPQNSYSGMVMTDDSGKAWVQLPDYFENINTNVKYQLTVVDDAETLEFAQAKIGREVENNRFLIMTSEPRTKVSWRIEADRNDRWVQVHGAPSEKEKPKSLKGTYLRPELYGLPVERSEHWHRLREAERQASTGQTSK